VEETENQCAWSATTKPVSVTVEAEADGMGVSVNVPFACMFPPLPLLAGRRYVWQLSVNGASSGSWRAAFLVNRDA
jgi:hypothetical protein